LPADGGTHIRSWGVDTGFRGVSQSRGKCFRDQAIERNRRQAFTRADPKRLLALANPFSSRSALSEINGAA